MTIRIVGGPGDEVADLVRAVIEAGHEAACAHSPGKADLTVVAVGARRAFAHELAAPDSVLFCPTVLLPEDGGLDALRAMLGLAARDVLRVAELTIDRERQEVWCAGQLIELTRTQFNLLVALACRAGQVISYRAIWLAAWGDDHLCDNTLSVHVRNLRRKLGDLPEAPLIRTHKGFGYALGPPDRG